MSITDDRLDVDCGDRTSVGWMRWSVRLAVLFGGFDGTVFHPMGDCSFVQVLMNVGWANGRFADRLSVGCARSASDRLDCIDAWSRLARFLDGNVRRRGHP